MSPAPFILGRGDPRRPSVTVNSIIAVEGNGNVEQETMASSALRRPHRTRRVGIGRALGHSAQGNPVTIEEVRRILRLHAGLKASTVRQEAP
jgi:hypothetical protein